MTSSPAKTFRVGDRVAWRSRGARYRFVRRTGRVVHVVPPNADPTRLAPIAAQFGRVSTVAFANAAPRDHESYLVQVPSRSGQSREVFWPPVDRLELAP
jgi:hypothetical protein